MRIRFDNGAGGPTPGAPGGRLRAAFARFPLPGTKARTWFLGAHGRLSATKGKRAGADHFTWKRTARPPTDFTGDTGAGDLWTADPNYDWTQNPPGSALSYMTKPMTGDDRRRRRGQARGLDQVLAPRVDLQATISEVRPNGQEIFVQNGWLRLGPQARRREQHGARARPEPAQARRRAAAPRALHEDVVPLYYQGHVYRKGSRLRVTAWPPRGDQPVWAFGKTRRPVPRGSRWLGPSPPARLVLPVVPGISAPTGSRPVRGCAASPAGTSPDSG